MKPDLSNIQKIRLVIYQPNTGAEPASEWECTPEYLANFAEEVKTAIAKSEQAKEDYGALQSHQQAEIWADEYLSPGEKQCRWCKAKSGCPAIAKECLSGLPDLTNANCVANEPDFESGVKGAIATVTELPLDTLSKLHKLKKLFCKWQDAIEDRLFDELSAGAEVADFKLVMSLGGHRKWTDEDEVESSMKAMRLKNDEMYQKKIISPTETEKLLKKRPKLWSKLSDKIERSEGKLQIAPITDKRPAINVQEKALEGLEDLTETVETTLLDFDLDDFEF